MTQSNAPLVSVVTPAYRAEKTLVRAVRSVLAQTYANWEMVVVADDEIDYETVLGRAGIADGRIRHFASGAVGSGSPPVRNAGLDKARGDIVAILDADDIFAPEKLERTLAAVPVHGLVSTALEVADENLSPRRYVGTGPDRFLPAGVYKFVNLSMDSMLVYDRRRGDPRFDDSFACLTDIAFLLRLFAIHRGSFHIGTPLHTYVKQAQSVSNKPGASALMFETKKRLLGLLRTGAYPLADPDGAVGLIDFYERSLLAERSYGPALIENPGLLFEDHLEPFLADA